MDRILDVPYLTQPTSITCQSTCLKMYGMYLASLSAISSPVDVMSILAIWKEINEGQGRPSQERNAYVNMAWWLHKYFSQFDFSVASTKNPDEAMARVVKSVDAKYPVIVSTNHSATDGHIILIVGYTGSWRGASSNVNFVCHDPYGRFNPALGSREFGAKRYDGGSSRQSGGEVGPGKGVVYDYNGIRRIRMDKHSSGTYFLVSADI